MHDERKRIWIVDDEPAVLQVLSVVLQADYVLKTFEDPQQYLQTTSDPPHIIISDYNMPGMSGDELLQEACHRYPSALRLLITGGLHHLQRFHCAHQIIMKPLQPRELRQTLRNCLAAIYYYQERHALFQAVQQFNHFPVLHLSHELMRCQPQDSLDTAIQVLQEDLSLYSRLRIMANSLVFNPCGYAAQTPLEIIQRIGLYNVKSAVFTAQLFLDYDNRLNQRWVRQLYQHSLAVAVQAYQIARKICPEQAHEVYFTGLMHDLGYLLLFHQWPELAHKHPEWLQTQPTREAEKQVLGFHSGELVAFLMHLWGMNPAQIDAVQNAEHPDQAVEGRALASLLWQAHQQLPRSAKEGCPAAAGWV